MKIAWGLLGSLVILLLFPGFAASDDLTGSDLWLCSAIEATVCDFDGDCSVGAPWLWDIPQFIEVDLTKKKIATRVFVLFSYTKTGEREDGGRESRTGSAAYGESKKPLPPSSSL